MPKFIMTVIKNDTYSTEIEIEAETLEQAERMAEDDARGKESDLDWSYMESEWISYGEQIHEEA